MKSIDSRKEAILEAVVGEYVQTGIPVGSLVLAQKYQFPYSTATIRAEMAELERLGYLSQPHISAGRVPTEKGYRYVVNLMNEENGLLLREEMAAKKRIQSMQGNALQQLDAASEMLSELTKNMGFAGFSNEVFSHGLSYLFSQPEFGDPFRVLKTAELIDNLNSLFYELPRDFETRILIGSEAPVGKAAECSIIVSQFESPLGYSGYLGVIGPMRMSYGRNLSAVREVKEILEEGHV